jgi:hypothetical protein
LLLGGHDATTRPDFLKKILWLALLTHAKEMPHYYINKVANETYDYHAQKRYLYHERVFLPIWFLGYSKDSLGRFDEILNRTEHFWFTGFTTNC